MGKGPFKRKKATAAERPKYPLATAAYYGPDDKTPTKAVVAIFTGPASKPVSLRRWVSSEVATDPVIGAEIADFIQGHGARQTIFTDGVIGCPHEEGQDFPLGEECPFCPFWRGKQGIRQRTDPGGRPKK